MVHHTLLAIDEISQVGAARRAAVRMVQPIYDNPQTLGNISIIVTELATNLVRYAREGKLLLRAAAAHGLDVIAMDCGPGMTVDRCLQDGYSTGGTAGTGLGAVRRLSHEFDAYSSPGHGSVVFSRVSFNPLTTTSSAVQWGAISLPAPGEQVCGDSWAFQVDDEHFRIVVSDGLGHGPDAHLAAQRVVDLFEKEPVRDPKTFLTQAHQRLSGTRGAAVANGHILFESDRFAYAGIGNIGGTLLTHQSSKGLMSHNGTVGCQIRSVAQTESEWVRGGWLVMYSDGLISRWSHAEYPGLLSRHPGVVAAVLVRDFIRGRDDVTVAVFKRC